MTSGRRPLFGSEWPRYAIVAHVVFWLISALLLASCLGAFWGFVKGDHVAVMLAIWIAAGMLVGAAGMCSGMLYFGNKIFSRQPTTGWSARLYGAFLFVCSGGLLLLVYGLTQIRGV